jgi:hypothetical protein
MYRSEPNTIPSTLNTLLWHDLSWKWSDLQPACRSGLFYYCYSFYSTIPGNMKWPVSLVFILVASGTGAQTPCDKLPYRLGHLTLIASTDLRTTKVAATKFQLKEMKKKVHQAGLDCDAFVRTSPGHPVSKELAFTVNGFASYLERCDSFCGTEDDLLELSNKETNEMMAPHK